MPGDPTNILVTPDDWASALADTDGLQLILAGPGAGKTEFLAQRARRLVEEGVPGAKVLLLTFSRRAAADLKGRVRLPDATPPHVATFHSLAFRILEAHAPTVLGWTTMPALLTGPEHVGVVRRLLAEESPAEWPSGFRDMLSTRTFAKEVTDFLLRAAERRYGPDDIRLLAGGRADWKALPAFMEKAEEAFRVKGRIDYSGVLSAALRILDDPGATEALAEQFSHVLVDEYQDTTDAQVALLHRLVTANGNLTVTADVDQSIYSFRGADLHNVERFEATFADLGPVTRLALTTSFRVPAAILTAARRLAVDDLPGAVDLEPAGPGGRVDAFVFDQHSHEAEWISGELERLHLQERIPFCRMAVLLRTKRRLLPELSRALERRGIPHDRPDARLIDHPAIRVVSDLVDLAVGAGSALDRERTLRRFLLGPLVGLPLGAERRVIRAIHRGEGSREDVIEHHVDDGALVARLLRDPTWATEMTAENGFWHAWTALPHWSRLATDPKRADYRVAWSSFSQVLGHLAERDADVSLRDFLHLASDDAFEANPLLRYATNDDRLTLTTLHAAKGLEFDVVVIADAVDGVMPDLRRSFSLLNTNQLHPDQQGTADAARFRIEEERRLVYTAMTRATSRVVFTATSAGIEETGERPSRFMFDATGGANPRPPEPNVGPPVTGLEAEAALRRTVADPTASNPAARLAALRVLVDHPHPAVRSVSSFTGIQPRGSDTGLIPDDASFSPSQATSYESCPRQYALSRHLGIGDEPSVYMSQGSLIHRVAETMDRRTLADPTHEPSVAEALAVLDVIFEPADFGGGPWAEAWRRRAGEIVTRLFAMPPSGGRVVAAEHDLHLELAGERWRGRADRIDHSPSGDLRVVDYKTGTSVLSTAEAATSLQLGFYVIAASGDDELSGSGTISGAELWYPAAEPNKSGIVTRRFDMGQLDTVRERLVSIASAIRAEEFPPSVGSNCRSCRARLICSEWPEGEEAFTP